MSGGDREKSGVELFGRLQQDRLAFAQLLGADRGSRPGNDAGVVEGDLARGQGLGGIRQLLQLAGHLEAGLAGGEAHPAVPAEPGQKREAAIGQITLVALEDGQLGGELGLPGVDLAPERDQLLSEGGVGHLGQLVHLFVV